MDETYVPGLNNREKAAGNFGDLDNQNANSLSDTYQIGKKNAKDEEPVVGFLYSLSRGGAPEWWPLHIGQNKVGKDSNMDICLAEASMTGHHANINIKRMRRSGNALSASIVDVGSKNGIILNDEELDYEPHTLRNEDKLIFGLNYKCVVILVDPTKYDLEENPEFVAVNASRKSAVAEPEPVNDFPSVPGNFDPFEGFNDNATINVNGDGLDIGGGSTKIL